MLARNRELFLTILVSESGSNPDLNLFNKILFYNCNMTSSLDLNFTVTLTSPEFHSLTLFDDYVIHSSCETAITLTSPEHSMVWYNQTTSYLEINIHDLNDTDVDYTFTVTGTNTNTFTIHINRLCNILIKECAHIDHSKPTLTYIDFPSIGDALVILNHTAVEMMDHFFNMTQFTDRNKEVDVLLTHKSRGVLFWYKGDNVPVEFDMNKTEMFNNWTTSREINLKLEVKEK